MPGSKPPHRAEKFFLFFFTQNSLKAPDLRGEFTAKMHF
jgi:hypothetical protein